MRQFGIDINKVVWNSGEGIASPFLEQLSYCDGSGTGTGIANDNTTSGLSQGRSRAREATPQWRQGGFHGVPPGNHHTLERRPRGFRRSGLHEDVRRGLGEHLTVQDYAASDASDS